MSFSLCLRVALLISLPAMPLAAQNADWRSYNGSLDGIRYSTLDQITTANASSLQQVCSFDTGENMSMQSGPVVVDGRLYFTTDTSTYAIDGATCEEIWHTARRGHVEQLHARSGSRHSLRAGRQPGTRFHAGSP